MPHDSHLPQIVILLGAAVVLVGGLRALRMSPMLGYLLAGLIIGPFGLNWVRDVEATAAIAEFGVIFLLFLIGLELSLGRLHHLRRQVFGFGTTQVVLTGLAIGGILALHGHSSAAAIILGGGLALSSTAVVLQLLTESGLKTAQVGRLAIATLILQDLAVIPLLVLVPVLGSGEGSLLEALAGATVKAVLGMMLIYIFAKLALRPLFRIIATHGQDELFAATALLVVLGMAYISSVAGMSPALGAFMAGLLIAETEFKPQIEADILPFKSIFLGLFFVSVGMSLNLPVLSSYITELFTLTALLIALKAAVLFLISRLFGFNRGVALHASLLLAQGSEFGFVLFTLAGEQNILSAFTVQMASACITLSMAATPLLNTLGARLADRSHNGRLGQKPMLARETADLRDHVIIAGYGRAGRVAGKLLEAERIPFVALDMDAGGVSELRAEGEPVYYGDASRAVVLKAVGIARARALLIAHGDQNTALATIAVARELHPLLPVIARARNVQEVMALEGRGANLAVAELMETSLQLGGALLRELDVGDHEVNRLLDAFRAEDYALSRNGDKGEGEENPENFVI